MFRGMIIPVSFFLVELYLSELLQLCVRPTDVSGRVPTRNSRTTQTSSFFLAASATEFFFRENLPNCFFDSCFHDRWMAKEKSSLLLPTFPFFFLTVFLFYSLLLQREKSRVSRQSRTVTGLISDRPVKTLSEWLRETALSSTLKKKKRRISFPFSRLIPVEFSFPSPCDFFFRVVY